ncbi:MAG: hypothetical protein ACRBF0_04285 [Calditrichia bacterium]
MRYSKKGPIVKSPISEKKLYELFQNENLVFPKNKEEVAKAERRMEEKKYTLPTDLQEPTKLLRLLRNNTRQDKCLKSETTPNPEVEENMARAAREGGNISPEIEAIMQRDRAKAESKSTK